MRNISMATVDLFLEVSVRVARCASEQGVELKKIIYFSHKNQ